MRFGAADGKFRFALDDRGDDLDVAFFPRRCAGDEFTGLRRHRARLVPFHIELMETGASDMRQRKARILRNRLVERILGTVPGR